MPVKLYSAVQERTVRFHMLQNRTKSRVRQQMVTAEGSEKVEREKIQKGYEVEPGTFVVLSEDELDKLKPKESRTIEATRFVEPSVVSHQWFERPYYLSPDDDEESYFALVMAMQKQNLCGIMRWTMRGKSYVGALQAVGDYLALIKLRYAEEVLPAEQLAGPSGAVDPKEMRMAEELLSVLEGSFHPEEFRDEYRERVLTFLEEKAKGKRPRLPVIREKTTVGSLSQQLSASLRAMKRNKEKEVA